MNKSARILGQEYGLTAQEMNFLLKDEGYLEGVPGNYSVTKKGSDYAEEDDHHRGTGGYSWYNRHWTTRVWDERILDELNITDESKQQIRQKITLSKSMIKADKENVVLDLSKGPNPDSVFDTETNAMSYDFEDYSDMEEEDGSEDGAAIAVGLLVIYGVISAAPHVNRWWKNKAFPGIQRLGKRIYGKETETDNTIKDK